MPQGASFGAGCAPIPEPFLWNPEFDVKNDQVNEEHAAIMKAVNVLACDVFNLAAIDDLYAKLRGHFAHEELVMESLLREQLKLLNEYEAIATGDLNSVSTFDSFRLHKRSGGMVGNSLEKGDGMTTHRFQHLKAEIRTFDPIFDAEIEIWPGSLVGELVRVDIRDFVLTQKRIETHKGKHAILLEDSLVVRRRVVRALHLLEHRKSGTKSALDSDPYNGNEPGAPEVSFVRNWYTQHVKIEDMAIRHSTSLIEKLRVVLDQRVGSTRSSTIRHLSLKREPTREKAVRFKWSDVYEEDDEDDTSEDTSVSTTDSMREWITRTSDTQINMAKQWMYTIQAGSLCGVLLLRPPGASHQGVRMVMASLSWSLMTGYEPWEVAGFEFGPFLGSKRSAEMMLQIQKWALEVRRADMEYRNEEIQNVLIMTTSFVHRDSVKVPCLMVMLPVLVSSHYMTSKKLSLLAFFFRSFHSLQGERPYDVRAPDLLMIAQARQVHYIKSRVGRWIPREQRVSPEAMKHRIGGRIAAVGGFQEDWKYLPLTNVYFRAAMSRVACDLLDNGFVTAELGVTAQYYPSRSLLRQRRDTRKRLFAAMRLLRAEEQHTQREHRQDDKVTSGLGRHDSQTTRDDYKSIRSPSSIHSFSQLSGDSAGDRTSWTSRETTSSVALNLKQHLTKAQTRVPEEVNTVKFVKTPDEKHKRSAKSKGKPKARKRSLWEELGLKRVTKQPDSKLEKKKQKNAGRKRVPRLDDTRVLSGELAESRRNSGYVHGV